MFRSQFFVKIWRHITFVQEAPMKHLLARVLALTGLPLFCQIPKGHIKGTVTDQNGNPVASATVYAATDFEGITLRSVKSNRNGEFDFRGAFNLGTYNIYSLKETDAYPDPTDKFYANPKIEAAKAELTEDHPSVTVAVSMGQKAAVLEGKVVDSASGNPTSARLIFLDEDGNGHAVLPTASIVCCCRRGKTLL